jgi:hypothetical protein
MLFHATAATLSTIAADPKHLGAEIGFFAVLHTWGQNLLHHSHLHCVVPGGGIAPDGSRWIACRARFFLPVRVLSRLFRRLFLKYLQEAFNAGKLRFCSALEGLREPSVFRRQLDTVRHAKWVVYAKAPFAGPQQVVDYLGHYTHRVAIANQRIMDIENGQVTFNWRDYRDHNQPKIMTLAAEEFIRRFLLHVLPLPPRIPSHPLLRLPGQSTPQREVGALPPAPGPDSAQPKPCPTAAIRGLSGPIRATHRPLAAAMPGVPLWPDDHGQLTGQKSCSSDQRRGLMIDSPEVANRRDP